jgi:alpha-amylase
MLEKEMSRDIMLRAVALAVCVLLFAGCAGGGSSADQRPTEAATPVAQANAPAPTTMTSAQASAAGVATAAPAAATATLDLPTPAPTITVGPTAAPFPLQTGWWENAVCYEIFVRSFYDSNGDGIGDINGLIQKLDYINDGDPQTGNDLGANCIWLMPIAESPSYHGYDVTDYYKVNHEYGTNDDFKRLVAEAHKRGIKIILDLVLNHTSSEHPWFQEALKDPNSPHRNWYLWSKDKPDYQTPWGTEAWHKSPLRDEYYYGIFWEGMPDLNYRDPAVTEEAHKVSAFWLNDMGADGFRLDAIKHLIEDGKVQENTPETHAWLRDYRAFLETTKPGTFTVGEIFGANPTTLGPYYPDQLDEYFMFDVSDKIVGAANSGLPLTYVTAVQNASSTLPFQRWAPFLTNHDQNRVMTTLGNDVSKAKIAATALLTLPGLPFLYYGEEIGMLGAKPDEQIRTPMQWAADATTGGFSSGRPWEALQKNYQEVNVAAQDGDSDSLLNLYRRLVHLHTRHPALGQGSFTPLKASDGAVAAFLRQTGDEAILVVLNFSKVDINGVTLSLDKSELATGSYKLAPLLGDMPGAQLTVGEGGSIAGYAPLPSLAPRTGYIFKLTR